jgi:arylsulfatase A-like enzyme
MKKPNVVILVIDTLREDYSSGLEALRELGFVKYENAIAPAPWTLPSHVSLITGLYPSQHGIHEAYGVYVDRELRKLSTQRLSTLNHGIIGELMDEGYSTYIVSANPFLSPLFGFTKFTENLITGYTYVLFRSYEEYKDHEELSLMVKDHGYIDTALKFIKERNLRMLNKAIKFFIKGRVTRLAAKLGVYDPTMEKGSHIIIDFLSRKKLSEPFFLLINIMEAHGPYTPKDLDEQLSFNAYFNAVFIGKLSDEVVRIWQSNYPKHAIYATKSAVKIIKVLRRYLDDSLVIIVADHGELLGDGGIFHGYFLKDKLLRVPLWIKWPSWVKPPRQVGPFISLVQVPSIIRAIANNEEPRVGVNVAIAESFGSTLPSVFSKWYSELPSETLIRVFAHRVRVYTRHGVATYNVNLDEFEEVSGDVGELMKTTRTLINYLDSSEVTSIEV